MIHPLNTLNMPELESAFKSVCVRHKVSSAEGIKDGHVKREDGLAWFELCGKFSKAASKDIVQDLADALNTRVIFNRYESDLADSMVCGVMDFNPAPIDSMAPVPAHSEDAGVAEFMEDYGKPMFPLAYVAAMKKTKKASGPKH